MFVHINTVVFIIIFNVWCNSLLELDLRKHPRLTYFGYFILHNVVYYTCSVNRLHPNRKVGSLKHPRTFWNQTIALRSGFKIFWRAKLQPLFLHVTQSVHFYTPNSQSNDLHTFVPNPIYQPINPVLRVIIVVGKLIETTGLHGCWCNNARDSVLVITLLIDDVRANNGLRPII